MLIGVLEILRRHSLTFVKTPQIRGESPHAELRNMKKRVESTEVENETEPTNAFGGQETVGVTPSHPPPPGPATC